MCKWGWDCKRLHIVYFSWWRLFIHKNWGSKLNWFFLPFLLSESFSSRSFIHWFIHSFPFRFATSRGSIQYKTFNTFSIHFLSQNQTIIRLVESRIEDGVLYCQVERDAFTTVKSLSFDLVNEKYYLLLASGDSSASDSIGRHNIDREASTRSLLLTEFSVVHGKSKIMLFIHASSMIIAWIGTTSIGIFAARFLKKTWIDVKIYGRDLWFMTHQVLQSVTWLLTLVGFVIIVVDADRWVINPHSTLGTIAFTLCMIQPIGAIFRPKPQSPARNIFNFIHLASGNAAHLLAGKKMKGFIVTKFFWQQLLFT